MNSNCSFYEKKKKKASKPREECKVFLYNRLQIDWKSIPVHFLLFPLLFQETTVEMQKRRNRSFYVYCNYLSLLN